MNIVIKTIPHNEHRYSTCGDWWWEQDGTLQIRVSNLSDWRREALIAVHELVEVLVCKHDGVDPRAVDSFDIDFEKNRVEGNEDEPGDDSHAPYRKQHCLATGVERVLAAALDVDWREYETELYKLP